MNGMRILIPCIMSLFCRFQCTSFLPNDPHSVPLSHLNRLFTRFDVEAYHVQ